SLSNPAPPWAPFVTRIRGCSISVQRSASPTKAPIARSKSGYAWSQPSRITWIIDARGTAAFLVDSVLCGMADGGDLAGISCAWFWQRRAGGCHIRHPEFPARLAVVRRIHHCHIGHCLVARVYNALDYQCPA